MELKADIEFDLDWSIPCWFAHGCIDAQTGCSADCKTDEKHFCRLYTEMNQLIASCGIPYSNKYMKTLYPVTKEEREVYKRWDEIRLDMVNFVKEGRNLLISSDKPQTGKTTMSLKLMYRYFSEIFVENCYIRRGYFIHVPELLNKLRNYDYLSSPEFKKTDKILRNVELVIWDDIINAPLNDRDINYLEDYLKYRDRRDKANIFNGTNIPDIKTFVGENLECIITSGEVLNLNGPSLKTRRQFMGGDK